ncbi:MAG: alpha/beta hydrolase, partial [Pseudomonadota bacterium]
MRTAPYHSDVTYGPKPNSAEWIDAADGKRLRMVSWSGGKKGTILLFQGRTEYAEKYGEVVQQLLDRGMSVATCDWRGQGLSERYARHYQIGEVDDFSDYQYDVEALMSFAKKKRLPKPYIALGHSLGGGILLRALHNGLDVKAAIFSSPMWGIQVPSVLKPFASFIVTLYRALGIADRLAPGRRLENYVDYQGFEGNTLTHDLREWNTLRRQVVSHPEFGLGGPSVNWVDLALRDGDAL